MKIMDDKLNNQNIWEGPEPVICICICSSLKFFQDHFVGSVSLSIDNH